MYIYPRSLTTIKTIELLPKPISRPGLMAFPIHAIHAFSRLFTRYLREAAFNLKSLTRRFEMTTKGLVDLVFHRQEPPAIHLLSSS